MIYGFAPHHYDTPGTFDKNHLVCHHETQYRQSKSQVGATNCSAYDKTSEKNYTHRKLNTQTKQSERRKNRYQTHNNESRNEYSHIQ